MPAQVLAELYRFNKSYGEKFDTICHLQYVGLDQAHVSGLVGFWNKAKRSELVRYLRQKGIKLIHWQRVKNGAYIYQEIAIKPERYLIES